MATGLMMLADPGWLTFHRQNSVGKLAVFYASRHKETAPGRFGWLFCVRRGNKPRSIYAVGQISNQVILHQDEAWARYGSALGAVEEKSWRQQAASVLSNSMQTYNGIILAIELTNYQPYINPVNLGSISIGDSGFNDRRRLDKAITDQLLNLLPKPAIQLPNVQDTPINIPTVGAGFGSPEENKKVEESAIAIITSHYKNKGWSVQSVENERIGYDLVCRNESSEENVEVKGISGGEVSFIITKNELNEAKSNPKFVLFVVLNALSPSPTIHRFSGVEFTNRFELSVFQYRATLVKK